MTHDDMLLHIVGEKSSYLHRKRARKTFQVRELDKIYRSKYKIQLITLKRQ